VPPEGPREDELAVDRAVRALARRDHSAASLRAKLDRAGVSLAAQAAAVARLERAGYVDDTRYAADRAVLLSERGYGDDWIRADLAGQGVDEPAVEAAVSGLEPELERAGRLTAKHGCGLRTIRSLGRRGFSEDTLEAVAATAVADDTGEGVGYESSV
jgi:regulatory protein